MPPTPSRAKAAADAAPRRRVVLPGGSGHLGRLLCRDLVASGRDVVVLTRTPKRERGPDTDHDRDRVRCVAWDGRRPGAWQQELDGAEAVINLAGHSVDCRYDKHNLEQMLSSRIDATRAVGAAIAAAARPPRVWLQMSTATIYAHRYDAANDEHTGSLGGDEPDAPAYWRFSEHIARCWERALTDADTPATRRVALRTAMVMSPEPGGPFVVLRRLARLRLGGAVAGGAQYVSWLHQLDFTRAVRFLLERDDLSGPVNLAAPAPLPQREFARELRPAMGIRLGLPASRRMVELGATLLGTDAELVLKSRRVVPTVLQQAGFEFAFPTWREAAGDLALAGRQVLR